MGHIMLYSFRHVKVWHTHGTVNSLQEISLGRSKKLKNHQKRAKYEKLEIFKKNSTLYVILHVQTSNFFKKNGDRRCQESLKGICAEWELGKFLLQSPQYN